jgi:PAS domain S-box-containing protein
MESQNPGNPVLRLRKQQELAARFGLYALRSQHIPDVLQEGCIIVSLGLNVSFSKVLRFIPAENQFVLETGVGWAAADIGTARLGSDKDSPAGYAFQTSQPVLTNDLATEKRFRTPRLLARYGIRRAINVIIRGETVRYGVLEADAPEEEHFSSRDIAFLETIANVIALALERRVAEDTLREGEAFSASVLEASADCIQVIGLDGTLVFMNMNGLELMQIPDLASIQGKPWAGLWPRTEAETIEQALEDAKAGKPSRFDVSRVSDNDITTWWDVTLAPVTDQVGQIKHFMAVSRDITERVNTETALSDLLSVRESLLDHKELLMLEVHHRVRNSLQLIQTLLSLQATTTTDASVRAHLNAASSRVMTVGAVHERLHKEGAPTETDAAAYLHGLMLDLRNSLADQRSRTIEVLAPALVMPAERLTALGLVATELVTNALKYGKGIVKVHLNAHDDRIELIVEDEGNGFPATFPSSQTGGLGIRLVKMFSRGGEHAIKIDRDVAHSRIIVRMPPVPPPPTNDA